MTIPRQDDRVGTCIGRDDSFKLYDKNNFGTILDAIDDNLCNGWFYQNRNEIEFCFTSIY